MVINNFKNICERFKNIYNKNCEFCKYFKLLGKNHDIKICSYINRSFISNSFVVGNNCVVRNREYV